ncbi:hypothetical protein EUGRSUZ_B00112 [Eucalyptus grandis]|uniref:Uncharacterized protein n=2 Tax=Eucalyptus grandis TaxID=71139 RepID=A0ACC3LLG6_EUCGR|nr:hypothetical protein EUGRSUZ_B00112 [Eucalyptus grandis]
MGTRVRMLKIINDMDWLHKFSGDQPPFGNISRDQRSSFGLVFPCSSLTRVASLSLSSLNSVARIRRRGGGPSGGHGRQLQPPLPSESDGVQAPLQPPLPRPLLLYRPLLQSEGQVIKTNQQNILIRALTIRKQRGEPSLRTAKGVAIAEGSRKRYSIFNCQICGFACICSNCKQSD